MNNRFKFSINESEKNRIRNLHGKYSVINEGMTSSMISQGSELLGDIDMSSEVPSLELQVVIQFVRACMGNFIESQETPFISQASEIVDGMSNAMFEELKKKGIETTPEQTYFLATLGIIRWLNINHGVMMGDMKGTCLEDFINTNSLRSWVPQMFSMGGRD